MSSKDSRNNHTAGASPDAANAEKKQLLLLAQPLLAWYDRHARVLPWRENPDPYWVWISEIMLQQTRLEVVVPYFHRFVSCFPDIPALAKAEEGLLLKMWEGLGYYNRVRNLQKAARLVMERYSGKLPASYRQLQELPGIGEYTAGAVASIAYGIPVPAVDGNVLRVMARLLNCGDDIVQPRVKKSLRAVVEAILPQERPGDFNQAMMDLGAMVCLPNASPGCELCPLRTMCAAYREGTTDRLPVKSPPKPRTVQQRTVLVLVSRGRTLIRRRSGAGLLAGLWEFPNLDGWLSQKDVAAWLEQQGLGSLSIRRLADSRHVFTHLEWNMRGYLIEVADALTVQDGLWVEEAAVRSEYALPSAFKFFTGQLALFSDSPRRG